MSKFEDESITTLRELDDKCKALFLALVDDLVGLDPSQRPLQLQIETVLRAVPTREHDDIKVRLKYMVEKYEEVRLLHEARTDDPWTLPGVEIILATADIELEEAEALTA